MDIQKLSDKKYTAVLYLIPFVLMLCGCLNFIFYTAYTLPTSNFAVFVIFHLLFLLSLSAVCGSLMIEFFLALFEDGKNSSLHSLIYGGQMFLPIRTFVFVAAFIAGYIVMMRFLPHMNSLKLLMLIIPSLAIFMNAHHFLSGRVRFINGVYLFYQDRFNIIFSYYKDENGTLVFVTDEGNLLNTGATAASADFYALEAEFLKNGLKCGGAKV